MVYFVDLTETLAHLYVSFRMRVSSAGFSEPVLDWMVRAKNGRRAKCNRDYPNQCRKRYIRL